MGLVAPLGLFVFVLWHKSTCQSRANLTGSVSRQPQGTLLREEQPFDVAEGENRGHASQHTCECIFTMGEK